VTPRPPPPPPPPAAPAAAPRAGPPAQERAHRRGLHVRARSAAGWGSRAGGGSRLAVEGEGVEDPGRAAEPGEHPGAGASACGGGGMRGAGVGRRCTIVGDFVDAEGRDEAVDVEGGCGARHRLAEHAHRDVVVAVGQLDECQLMASASPFVGG
jgi:hypothetical protein